MSGTSLHSYINKIKMSNCSLLGGYESSDGRARKSLMRPFILVMVIDDKLGIAGQVRPS